MGSTGNDAFVAKIEGFKKDLIRYEPLVSQIKGVFNVPTSDFEFVSIENHYHNLLKDLQTTLSGYPDRDLASQLLNVLERVLGKISEYEANVLDNFVSYLQSDEAKQFYWMRCDAVLNIANSQDPYYTALLENIERTYRYCKRS